MNRQEKELSALEHEFAARLRQLFARVDARLPEKGIAALLKRARERAANKGLSPEAALEMEYLAAEKRTEARLSLLSACPTQKPEP